jgi:hypothetical protein
MRDHFGFVFVLALTGSALIALVGWTLSTSWNNSYVAPLDIDTTAANGPASFEKLQSTTHIRHHPSYSYGHSHGNHEPIIAHIVPHSHCDAAYKKTFDEYYETEVRNVLNSVLLALEKDSSRRFSWAETSFLTKWWQDPRTTDQQKRFLQRLLVLDRMEIVNGGWVMHDEAISRYDSQIHQMIEGHDRLQQMLVDKLHRPNVSVSTGWQIDPFGASAFTVNLHAWAGMDVLVLNRMPQDIKDQLKANQTLQFYWETPQAKLLVHVMDTHYGSPNGFDWESSKGVPVTKENVRDRSDAFMDVLLDRANYYRTPHILVPFGGDFTFQNASLQFQNMDRIMNYIQGHPERYNGTVLQYSTPRQFKEILLEVLSSKNQSLPSVQVGAAFQPLWTGYYFQLPNLKQMLRTCEALLRTCEVRMFQALRGNASWDWLSELIERIKAGRKTVGLMQHHDAITATSYRFVIADYMQRLSSSFNDMSDVLVKLVEGESEDKSKPGFSTWTKGNIVGGGPYVHESLMVRDTQSSRSITLDKVVSPQMGMGATSLAVLNSLGQRVDSVVHFHCTRPDVAIVLLHEDGSTESIPSQATPLEHELEVSNLGLFLISFRSSIPALGKSQYLLQVCDLTWSTEQHPSPRIPSLDCAQVAKTVSPEELAKTGLTSSMIQVDFDENTLDLASFRRLNDNGPSVTTKLTHDLMLYYGGNDTIYALKTNVESSDPPPLFGPKRRRLISAYSGRFFSQVFLEFTPWLLVRYRVMNGTATDDDSLLQVTMFAGPLPPSVNLASRFETDWTKTNWFVDQNGFLPTQVLYNSSQGVGDGNARPLVSRTWLDEDQSNNRLTLFSVDPHAVVSKRSGQMDVFWHRRNNCSQASWNHKEHDWWKEGDDKSSSRSSVWLRLSTNKPEAEIASRQIASRLSNDLVLLSMGASNRLPPDIPLPARIDPNLHIVSIRLSQADKSLNDNREEAWLDLQIENLSESLSGQTDLVLLFGGSSRLFLNALSLYSLTYLVKAPPVLLELEEFDGCSLKGKDGGRQWMLTVGARKICSVRIPVSPLKSHEDKDN